MTRYAIALAALVAAPALAQDLPVFDESLGFEVRGTVDDGLILSNGGATFYCEVGEGPDDGYLVLDTCLPILGPKAAAQLDEAAAGAAQSAESFAEAVDRLPPVAMVGAVERTLQAFGCTLSKDDDKTEIQMELARQAAQDAGYRGPLTEDVLDAVGEKGEDTLKMMIDAGLIVVDAEDDRRVRLLGCP
ncbi:hypothetical protein [Maliponia aquimaris]|uniref:Uncharacterized protein n=1 Tax=Maliponia aquimaris TaxID=1673631 RepID=A0A238K178_9RHOB|nr:hypothetical protein [Maliponia aquimaris]SMX36635.1 hypothetical protein MAA8898_00939 [Maliponia aquimaris]